MLKRAAIKKVLPVLLLLVLSVPAFAACSSGGTSTPTPAPTPTPKPPAPKASGPIKPTWIKAVVEEDTASIMVSEVQRNIMSHFEVGTSAGEIAFMAYQLDGKTQVRASICPPCRSESFSLNKSTLVCDTCATVFDAKTGDGIKGACVNFPKAAVSYDVSGDKILMKGNDLIGAYRDTLTPGRS